MWTCNLTLTSQYTQKYNIWSFQPDLLLMNNKGDFHQKSLATSTGPKQEEKCQEDRWLLKPSFWAEADRQQSSYTDDYNHILHETQTHQGFLHSSHVWNYSKCDLRCPPKRQIRESHLLFLDRYIMLAIFQTSISVQVCILVTTETQVTLSRQPLKHSPMLSDLITFVRKKNVNKMFTDGSYRLPMFANYRKR